MQEINLSLLCTSTLQVEAEIARRRNRGKEHVQRSTLIRAQYRKLHPSVYTLSVRLCVLFFSWLLTDFLGMSFNLGFISAF